MDNSRVSDPNDSRFPYMKSASLNYHKLETDSPRSWNGDFGFGSSTDRRFAFSRQASFRQSPSAEPPHTPISIIPNDSVRKPFLSRTVSSIDIPHADYPQDGTESLWTEDKLFSANSKTLDDKVSIFGFLLSIFRAARSGNRPMKRLFMLISLNVAYSTAELFIGLVSGRIGMHLF